MDVARLELLKYTARSLGHTLPVFPVVPLPGWNLPLGRIPEIEPGGAPGVSLVTCSMNRTSNLMRALESWIACPEIREIVIVDWSSENPVRDELKRHGIDDPRLRTLRVEGESRWILSYAFNAGFRVASCNRILKADADIVVSPDFFARNPLNKGNFIAGNWRIAPEEQSHINGFFYLHRDALAEIAGFNEYITTYGWDDDDIYGRLEDHGLTRRDVDVSTIHHLPHSDEERTGRSGVGRTGEPTAADALRAEPMFLIRQNRFIANVMPAWKAGKTLLPLEVTQSDAAGATVRRLGYLPHSVSGSTQGDAEHYALRELTAWRLGERAVGLDQPRLDLLLGKPFSELGRIDVELALSDKSDSIAATGGYVVLSVQKGEMLDDRGTTRRIIDQLAHKARAQGLTPVLSGPVADLPEQAADLAQNYPFLANWLNLGPLDTIDPKQLERPLNRQAGQHFKVELKADVADATTTLSAPQTGSSRPRIYVDGQHGLGNRLRAIGSAASIAQKSGHELVIVWQPDSHCGCRFGDLFDYDGAVIEESFVGEAARKGCRVYNYMEVEEGAEKDALVSVDGSGDIYARAAYVFNSPLSHWEDENRFLRALRPVTEVRDMVASVRTPNDVSAHVRMAGGKAYEHLPYEQSGGNWTEEGHEAIAHWRERSHFSRFFKRLDALIATGQAHRIFLAADLPETYAEFKAAYGDRVAILERTTFDRSAEQLRYALADALLLGQSPRLLGSSWSSFSELAMRMSPNKMQTEMSGVDF